MGSVVIFQLSEESLRPLSAARRRDVDLALVELNEDAAEAGLSDEAKPLVIGRGPQGGLVLSLHGAALPLSRQSFSKVALAYTAAMDRLSRACATPYGPQGLSRFDADKARVHQRGALLVARALAEHVTLSDLVARRLFTVAYLVVATVGSREITPHLSVEDTS